MQFVGRKMRVIEPTRPAILSITASWCIMPARRSQRWEEFQHYSEADREFFDRLLPVGNLDFKDSDEIRNQSALRALRERIEVRAQSDIRLEEIPLIDETEAVVALKILQQKGYTPDEVKEAYEVLPPDPTTKVRERQARARD